MVNLLPPQEPLPLMVEIRHETRIASSGIGTALVTGGGHLRPAPGYVALAWVPDHELRFLPVGLQWDRVYRLWMAVLACFANQRRVVWSAVLSVSQSRWLKKEEGCGPAASLGYCQVKSFIFQQFT